MCLKSQHFFGQMERVDSGTTEDSQDAQWGLHSRESDKVDMCHTRQKMRALHPKLFSYFHTCAVAYNHIYERAYTLTHTTHT